MESPTSKRRKNFLASFLIKIHQQFSHSNRVKILADEFVNILETEFGRTTKIRCLDVGCGDMKLAELIEERLPNTQWNCIDIFSVDQVSRKEKRWKKYQQFDGKNIPALNKEYDVVILADVLHHSGENQLHLLKECVRTGKIIVIKDHLETGIISRKILQLMDIVGNWGYGVKIPKKYFNETTFNKLCAQAGIKSTFFKKGIKLYEHLPVLRKLLNPNWQFITKLIKI